MSTVKSFRDFALDSLEVIIYREGFSPDAELAKGIAYLANVLCNYEEESIRLRPEIIITTDLPAVAKTLPTHLIIAIDEDPITLNTFKRALKACAPLARDNWIIYFDIGNDVIRFGLLASGMSQPNPSPYSHLKVGFSELQPPVIFLKALSPQLLLVKSKAEEFMISFSLEEFEHSDTNYLTGIAEQITLDIDEEWRVAAIDLFSSLLEQASESSHGCLIGVLDKSPDALSRLRTQITNGIFIPEPIDVAKYLADSLQINDSNSQMTLTSICSVVKRMIGHDGITLFSSRGELLAYNLFVPSNDEETRNIIGGARSRAFKKLCALSDISCALFRSQDGAMKLYKK